MMILNQFKNYGDCAKLFQSNPYILSFSIFVSYLIFDRLFKAKFYCMSPQPKTPFIAALVIKALVTKYAVLLSILLHFNYSFHRIDQFVWEDKLMLQRSLATTAAEFSESSAERLLNHVRSQVRYRTKV